MQTSNPARIMNPHKGTLEVVGPKGGDRLQLVGLLHLTTGDSITFAHITTSVLKEIIRTPSGWLGVTQNSCYTLIEFNAGILEEICTKWPDLYRDERAG